MKRFIGVLLVVLLIMGSVAAVGLIGWGILNMAIWAFSNGMTIATVLKVLLTFTIFGIAIPVVKLIYIGTRILCTSILFYFSN